MPKELSLVRPVVKDFRDAEVKKFEKGQLEIVTIEGREYTRITFEPGWRWSVHMKPIAKTEYCEMSHTIYQVSGRMRIKLFDGSEFDFGPGSFVSIPAGHDGWVLGNEPSVAIDLAGDLSGYVKS